MPISKTNRALYPKNWKEIRVQIMKRALWPIGRFVDGAGNPPSAVDYVSRCECTGECGLHQPCPGVRRCTEIHGMDAEYAEGRVVLTIAHLDHDPTNNDPANLKAMCQRCHNRYDQPHRQKNAAKTRRNRKASGDLLNTRNAAGGE